MKERIPIWFQSLAVVLLCGVYALALNWVWQQDQDDPLGRGLHRGQDILFMQMPLVLLYLVVRLMGHVLQAHCKTHWPSKLFVGLAVSVAAVFLIVILFGPPLQPLRG